MRKIFLYFCALILTVAVIFNFRDPALSYDTGTAHPFLAEKSVSLFNGQNSGYKLSPQETAWVMQGAVEEDTPVRWMNHFYDPNTGYGLPGYAPANVWANLSLAQMTYARGDQSWSAAIAAYARGDEKQAFMALGHILHLIADMTVPAHTRIDIHIEGDPYEEWVKLNTNEKTETASLIKINDLNQAFGVLAKYSNNNFFSKDTIDYNLVKNKSIFYKQVGNENIKCVKGNDNDNKFCLLILKKMKAGKTEEYYFDPVVHSDYYSLLAPKAIGYGAGVIDLFFKQAESEKNKKLTVLERLKQSFNKTSGTIINAISGLFTTYGAAVTNYSNNIAGGNNRAPVQPPAQSKPAGQVLAAYAVAGEQNTTPSNSPLSGGEQNANPPSPPLEGGQKTQIPPTPPSLRSGQALVKGGEMQSLPGGEQNSNPVNPSLGELGTGLSGGGQNSGGSASAPIFVAGDRAAPETEISAAPEKITKFTAADFAFNASEANSSFECNLDNSGWQACGSPKSLSGLADGTHNFKVRATDPSGNTDPTPAEHGWTVDATAPTSGILSAPAVFASSTAARFIFSADDAGAVFNCRLDENGWSDCLSPADYKNLADGAHKFKVKATDAAGNIGQAAEHGWTVDATAPAVVLNGQPASFASSTLASFTFAADEAVKNFSCNLDDSSWSNCASPVNYENLSQGAHKFKVKATDPAGNETATPAEYNWNIRLNAPVVAIVSSPPDMASSTSAGFQLAADGANVVYQCQLDNGGWQTCSASTTVFDLVQGQHGLKVRGVDLAGNTGSSTLKTWLVDLTAPDSTVAALPAAYQTENFTVNWSGGDELSGLGSFDLQYKIGVGDWQDWLTATTAASAVFSLAADSGQTVFFRSRARDLAGNLENWPAEASASTTKRAAASHLVISQLQTRGASADDEFIELYNPTDNDISLSGSSIQYRGGAAKSFYKKNFLTGSAVKAKSYFLIASDKYTGSAMADFIYAGFSLSGSGGTVFLVNGANLLTNDTAAGAEVIDRLAYGAGGYLLPEGAAYATAPAAGQSLERKALAASTAETMAAGGAHAALGNGYDSDNNGNDFVLKNNSAPRSSINSSAPRPVRSAGLAHLWHFDECAGAVLTDSAGTDDLPQNAGWTVGKSQCAINQPWQAQYYIDKTFSSPLPAGELTLSFYWRNSSWPNEGRNHVYLKKAGGNIAAGVTPSIYSRTLYYDGGATTTIPAMPADDKWHLITVTYSSSKLVYYLDGSLKAVFNGNYAIGNPLTGLEIRGENWPVDLDELAVWTRALGSDEAADIYNSGAPLEPYIPRPPQQTAQLIHWWHFDEGAGATAADSVGVMALSPIVKWTGGKFNSGIEHTWLDNYLISRDLDQPINSKDLSLDFWWRNSAYPNEGRASLELQTSAGVKAFGLRPGMDSGSYYFDGTEAAISNFIPRDGQWHHLALVYDSYNFSLAFYVDGAEKIRVPKVWFRRPITKLVIRGENWFYGIDELAIRQGALSAAQVMNIYQGNQP